MASSIESEITKIEKNLDKRIPIPNRWKNHILKVFKDEISDIEELDELPSVIKKWSWIYRSPKKVWEVIDILDMLRATTVYFMVNWTINNLDIVDEDIIRKKWSTLRKRYHRGLYQCLLCGIIHTVKIPPEDVGRGKRAVTMWVSPFAKDKDIRKCREIYLAIGGELGMSKKLKRDREHYEKSANKEIEYRNLVRRKTFINKVKRMEKIGINFYECPKCNLIIKILKDDEHLYTIDDNKLLDPCKCGNKFREKIIT
jgi:hypothetical protein